MTSQRSSPDHSTPWKIPRFLPSQMPHNKAKKKKKIIIILILIFLKKMPMNPSFCHESMVYFNPFPPPPPWNTKKKIETWYMMNEELHAQNARVQDLVLTSFFFFFFGYKTRCIHIENGVYKKGGNKISLKAKWITNKAPNWHKYCKNHYRRSTNMKNETWRSSKSHH